MRFPLSFGLRAASLLLLTTASWAAAPQEDAIEWGPWYALLPIDHPDGSAKIATVHSPEKELKRMKVDGPGPDLEREHKRKGGKKGNGISWFQLFPEDEKNATVACEAIQFAQHFPTGLASAGLTENAVAYLYRSVYSEAPVSLPVTLGSDDGLRVWLNGKLVHEFNGGRGVSVTDDPLDLALAAGTNHLLVKVGNGGGAWGFGMQAKAELSSEGRQELQPAINDAIDQGVDYLIKTQQRDGSWGYSAGGYRNGQTALSLYALLKSGVKPRHQAIQRGLEYLRLRAPRKTYSTGVQILALSSTNNPSHVEWIEQLVEELADWQQGDFAYPDGANDLSCTQYGAFGYWVGSLHEIKVPKRAWTDLARSVLKYQNDDGGFAYRPGGKTTGSMTVAGLTVIAVCRQYFGEQGFPKQWRNTLNTAHEDGMRWMAENFRVDRNPAPDDAGQKRWKYYYLYGVERLAALLETDKFGSHDWYWEGAEDLVKAQAENGSWGTAYGENEPNTAFALLFLNRATATVSGPGASTRQGRIYVTKADDASVVMRAKGDTPLSLWISEISPAAYETHKRSGERGEGLYLETVEYFADGVSVARVEADPTKPWSSEPYATRYSFPERGDHEVQVKLHFAEVPGAEGGRPEPLLSPIMKVRVDERLEDWMLEYTDDRRFNLAVGERKQASASSKRGDGHAAGKAFDGFQSTSWICKADDKDPAVTVEFNKAVRIDRLVLSHAAGAEINRGEFDRATKVEVDLGGKREPLLFDIDPDENLKTTLTLPRKLKVSRLRIRVLERADGTKHKGCVGFAEIELRLGEKKARK